MSASLSVSDQIRQLNDARKLVLGDVKYYPSVVQGLLPIIGPSARLELRRWGAEFLAEAFATPALPLAQKETMQLFVLDTLRSMIENLQEDSKVVRLLVLCAASIYPLALRWIINNAYDTQSWEKMAAIKARILNLWSNSIPSVRICCIKFAQRVVLAQSAASGTEHKYGANVDISLDGVPTNHQTLDPRTLEAEAMGLLDRMLAVLQDNSSDALIVDATLNCLSVLARTRPSTSNRILHTLLNFNPLKLANSPMTPTTRVLVRSMEKTSRQLLIHFIKRDPNNPINPRIQQHVERLVRAKTEILEDPNRRGRPDGMVYVESKPQSVQPHVPLPPDAPVPLLDPGSHSLAEVFTLISVEGFKSFDVSVVPLPLVARICAITMARLDAQQLSKAIDAVRARLAAFATLAPAEELNPNTAPLGVDEDDDDYEPDLYAAEDTEQILNKLDSAPSTDKAILEDPSYALQPFKLPLPPVLPLETSLAAGHETVDRVLGLARRVDDPALKKRKVGFARLAATSYDRDGWTTILARLATRAALPPGIDSASSLSSSPLATTIREQLYSYVIEDFRRRIDTAVSWLSEEWYNDKRRAQASETAAEAGNYGIWVMRVMDGILPYLNAQDKGLTRFLAELPELDVTILSRVKYMCGDPSLVPLALTSLLYLVMMRPPVREIALDTVQDIWTEYEDARSMAAKYLIKYRPDFLDLATRDGDCDVRMAVVADAPIVGHAVPVLLDGSAVPVEP